MTSLISYFQKRPSGWTLFFITLAALPLHLSITAVLNASYAASKFPVPYFVQQTSFDPEKMRGWYAFMAQEGTLGRYITTQHIDFLFMLSVLVLHVSVLLWISRWFAVNTKARTVMIVCALLSVLAPVADALENGVTYVMLADISNFHDYLAYLSNSLSVLKFAMFVFAYAAIIMGALAACLRVRLLPARPGT